MRSVTNTIAARIIDSMAAPSRVNKLMDTDRGCVLEGECGRQIADHLRLVHDRNMRSPSILSNDRKQEHDAVGGGSFFKRRGHDAADLNLVQKFTIDLKRQNIVLRSVRGEKDFQLLRSLIPPESFVRHSQRRALFGRNAANGALAEETSHSSRQ